MLIWWAYPHLSLSCFRHGTVFLMQVPLSGSTSSTMTNGASSRVTMDRWSSCSTAPEYSSKRGHTWYLIVKEPLSHLPTCMSEWEGGCDTQATWKGYRHHRQHLKSTTEERSKEERRFTLSHCLSLSRRMMTSLGNIWWPFSLNDRFRPSNVTFIRYLRKRSNKQ